MSESRLIRPRLVLGAVLWLAALVFAALVLSLAPSGARAGHGGQPGGQIEHLTLIYHGPGGVDATLTSSAPGDAGLVVANPLSDGESFTLNANNGPTNTITLTVGSDVFTLHLSCSLQVNPGLFFGPGTHNIVASGVEPSLEVLFLTLGNDAARNEGCSGAGPTPTPTPSPSPTPTPPPSPSPTPTPSPSPTPTPTPSPSPTPEPSPSPTPEPTPSPTQEPPPPPPPPVEPASLTVLKIGGDEGVSYDFELTHGLLDNVSTFSLESGESTTMILFLAADWNVVELNAPDGAAFSGTCRGDNVLPADSFTCTVTNPVTPPPVVLGSSALIYEGLDLGRPGTGGRAGDVPGHLDRDER